VAVSARPNVNVSTKSDYLNRVTQSTVRKKSAAVPLRTKIAQYMHSFGRRDEGPQAGIRGKETILF
jgi:hypothetical protein